MLIRRCAWHRLYKGYPMLYGLAAWRHHGLQYTDGMCRRCAVTALEEWTRGPGAPPPTRRLRARLGAPVVVAVAAASIAVLMAVAAAALRHGGGREASVSALPGAVVDGVPAPAAPPRRAR